MENFVVSARKYRPARFDDVIGQPQVTQTLKNAIRSNQVAQAFLFCGPRGVGKTTCARILAKVINCENITKDIEACNECPSCKAFNENASFNVHELDAASNNSVEDMRTLIEQVRYAPPQGKKKIYIIDEVHMLSQAAFNAFLKTLEEPPPYAIFILATTEKHKIIPTILSRCQIFDFNRIRTDDVAAYLKNIAVKEHILAEDDALHLVAQKSDGAMRDALSMFDRLAVFGNNTITYSAAIDNLNILDYEYFFKLVDAFLAEDVSDVLLAYDQVLQKGFEGDNFLQGLSEHIRNLMVCKDKVTIQLLQSSENLKQRYLAQSMYVPTAYLINALNLLQETDTRYKAGRNKRLLVEMTLIKLCYLGNAIKLAGDEDDGSTEVKKKAARPPITPYARPEPIPVVKTEVTPQEVKPKEPVTEKPAAKKETVKPETAPVKNESPAVTNALGNLGQFRKLIKVETKQDKQEEGPEEFSADTYQVINSRDFIEAVGKLDNFLNEQKKYLLKPLMLQFPPRLSDPKKIEIAVSSEVNYNKLQEEKDFIAEYFKKALAMEKIWLEIKVNKEQRSEETKVKPYSATDRFKYLAAKNPKLQELKDKLKLDIE